ncbi:hypothetical protein RND81_06G133800 [Saponaria officinalis]|uniref:PGG domain-containing protein n=1 Tax=Saponaria officinalis TaxID=3572 RepID=A0AAW1KCN6_SAPOF
MKKTAESCALVAALIATVAFTAALQLPGGLNNNTGSPVLVKKTLFVFFAMSNAMSLFTSTASILVFLSILTSRYAERDFLISLPQKLMTGLILLLISIAAMVAGFTATFFIAFHEGLKWPPIIIAILASVPITLFALQQFPLLAEMYYSTYKSQNVFLPGKNKLFQVNPSHISALKWRNPNTPLHRIKQHHVDHNLKSYLPSERPLTDSDIFTMSHTEGYVDPCNTIRYSP